VCRGADFDGTERGGGASQLPLTFVIGTGRCGSTMLSRMLHMHPQVLSLSEFWNAFRGTEGRDVPVHEMSGLEFWQRITAPVARTDGFEVAGIPHGEFLYPADRGRFDPATGVPALSRVLAELTDDPDGLYDKLASLVPGWPVRSVAAQCRALFAALAGMCGRAVVVERTGGSAPLMPMLRQQFPGARFVYLHRDGPDSALSMSRHAGFRLIAMRAIAEEVRNGSFSVPAEMLSEEIREARPEDFDGLVAPPFDRERFQAYSLPPALFGWLWSTSTRAGTSEILQVARDRWTTMRYERILADPRTELSGLAGFIGVAAESGWLDRVAEFVDAGRAGRAPNRLHPSDLAALRTVCAAGTRAFDLLEAEAGSGL
jgi:hypothetical protein